MYHSQMTSILIGQDHDKTVNSMVPLAFLSMFTASSCVTPSKFSLLTAKI